MKNTVSNEEMAALSNELSLLLHAGVGNGDVLALLAEESGGEEKEMFLNMAEQVDNGAPLSAAFRKAGRFSAYVCGLLEVGEQTGRTEETLNALAQYHENQARLTRQIRNALLYPAIMLVLMLTVIAVLLVRVLPIFDDVYASLGSRLTGAAGALLSLGRVLESIMPLLWGLLIIVALFGAAFALIEPFRARILASWRKVAGDRGLSRKLNTARLAQAMAMAMASGLSSEEAVSLASGLMTDTPAAQNRCNNCLNRLENGESLSAALKNSDLLPAAQCRLLELGQRSGAGDASMEKIARDLTEEGENALEELVGKVEPALVLVCSLLVGLILLSVMLPLMHIMAAIG